MPSPAADEWAHHTRNSGTEGARTKGTMPKCKVFHSKGKDERASERMQKKSCWGGMGEAKECIARGRRAKGTRVPDEGGGGGLSSAQGKAAGGFAGRQKTGAGLAQKEQKGLCPREGRTQT
jgi:hypothetical protein